MAFAALSRGIAAITKFEAPMDRRIVPLIMCGGAGTRLWPASREVRPKQFLPLFAARSTFQDTMLRVSDAKLFERPIVITNTAYRFMVLEQLAEIGLEADVLLEPMRRDSGPAIAADAGRIVTFGVRPERAATEYGYISPGEPVSGEIRAVMKFVEKPDPVKAAEYIRA